MLEEICCLIIVLQVCVIMDYWFYIFISNLFHLSSRRIVQKLWSTNMPVVQNETNLAWYTKKLDQCPKSDSKLGIIVAIKSLIIFVSYYIICHPIPKSSWWFHINPKTSEAKLRQLMIHLKFPIQWLILTFILSGLSQFIQVFTILQI